MKNTRCYILIAIIALFFAIHAEAAQTTLVGRISHIEGQLLRYVHEDKDWTPTVRDAPFGLNDALYSGERSRAEFIMPNNTWLRIGSDTQIQLISVTDNLTELDMASGTARFYNRSSDGVIRALTSFGYITAPPSVCFDLYVGNDSMEIVSLNGRVEFVHVNGDEKYDVNAGSDSLIADKMQVSSGQGIANRDWNAWNVMRNNVWESRSRVRGESVKYLPQPLHDEAYILEENGRWENVYYEGKPRSFWRPVHVSRGWAPFTVGRWTEWYGDNCWIPAESFGYVTHHYGNWLYVNNFWYWSPPVAHISMGISPFIGMSWYPGRVSWIHSGANIGWVPLAPHEIYHSNRYWGPASVVVTPGLHMNIGGYRHINHAVVVNQKNFYRVNNYSNVRVAHINHKTIVNNYRAAPVVNHTVIKNYDRTPARHRFTNDAVISRPNARVPASPVNTHIRPSGSQGRQIAPPTQHIQPRNSDIPQSREHRRVEPQIRPQSPQNPVNSDTRSNDSQGRHITPPTQHIQPKSSDIPQSREHRRVEPQTRPQSPQNSANPFIRSDESRGRQIAPPVQQPVQPKSPDIPQPQREHRRVEPQVRPQSPQTPVNPFIRSDEPQGRQIAPPTQPVQPKSQDMPQSQQQEHRRVEPQIAPPVQPKSPEIPQQREHRRVEPQIRPQQQAPQNPVNPNIRQNEPQGRQIAPPVQPPAQQPLQPKGSRHNRGNQEEKP